MDHPAELEADFQQFYALDLNGLLDRGEWRRAAVLLSQLPADSRYVRAVQPALAWGPTEYLLAYIADSLAFLRFELTHQNGGRGGRKPKPYPRPKAAEPPRKVRPEERTVHGMSADRVGEILMRPRE